MPEPIIHDSTPKGNAILAYGESSRRSRLPIILALAAGVLVCAFAALSLAVALGKTIPLPATASAILYVKPGMPMPDGLPEIWTKARTMSGPFPVILGLRRDDGTGGQVPFAIVPSFVSAASGPSSWAFRLIEDSPSGPVVMSSPRSIAGSFRAFADRNVWIRLWPDRLLTDATVADNDGSIKGTFSDGLWRTDIKAPDGIETRDRISGQDFVAIRTVPGAWPVIESMIRDQGIDLRMTVPPSAVSWTFDQDGRMSLEMRFDAAMSTTTKAELAGSMGLADTHEYTLEDGTVVTELRLPMQAVSSSTDTSQDAFDRIVFRGQDVFLGNPDAFSDTTELPQSCRGPVIAVLDGKSVSNLLAMFHLPFIFEIPNRIVWLERDGNVVACW